MVSARGARARSPHAGAPTESIFNVIFEFSAVFTCYLTYMPIPKKVALARPQSDITDKQTNL